MKTEPDHLIRQYLQESISELEEKELLNWANQSEANKKEFEESKTIWQLAGEKPSEADFSSHEEWDKLSKALRLQNSDLKSKPFYKTIPSKQHRAKSFWPLGIAATIALLFISYFVFDTSKGQFTEIYASENEVKKAILPDGSQAWVNERSRISFPENFDTETREVILEGEAFFDVVKNEQKPFIVKAGDAITKVVGTSFNLETDESKEIIEIVVVSGKVSFYSALNPNRSVLLEQGMKGVYLASSDSIYSTDNGETNFLAWQTDKLIFDNTPIKDVLQVLNKQFNVDIQVSEQEILSCKFTSTFEKATLKEVLNILSLSLGLHYMREGDRYILKGEGC